MSAGHAAAVSGTAVSAAVLQDWAVACLHAVDMPADDAAVLAASLVQTSLWGIDSHGIARLPDYLHCMKEGSMQPRAAITVTRTGPCTAQVHGGSGQGIVVAHRANAVAMDLAAENGVGVVGVSDSSHCGAMGLYTRAAARRGLIGCAFTHAAPMLAPFGGSRPFLGTNPLSIAVPREGPDGPDEPLCLDMATTAMAWNRVLGARAQGEALPPEAALDAAGQPTTDPRAARSLAALGGSRFGYKGYGLSLLIDLLCGALHGNPSAPDIPVLQEQAGEPSRRGAFFIVLDPLRFAGGAAFAAAVAALAATIAAEPGSPRMPGDPERAEEAHRRRAGIPVDAALATQMRRWSERLAVAAPL